MMTTDIGCKILSLKMIMTYLNSLVPANSRASSRGKTRGASVIHHDWA